MASYCINPCFLAPSIAFSYKSIVSSKHGLKSDEMVEGEEGEGEEEREEEGEEAEGGGERGEAVSEKMVSRFSIRDILAASAFISSALCS